MYIGAHCICVNDEGLDCTDFEPRLPVNGGHYVIRDILPPDITDKRTGIMLVGIHGIRRACDNAETCFLAERFRLLEEIKAENIAKAESEKSTA